MEKNTITEQAKLALRMEYNDWRHENSLYILEQYDKARSLIGEDKMAPLECFSQVFFSELVMIQKGRVMKEKLKAKLEQLKAANPITVNE